MRLTLAGLALLTSSAMANAGDLLYRGTWVTTNRQLDGTMSCTVTDLGGDRWRGHFHGVWYGRPFSYKVTFSGPPDKLKGKARIDGADYEWTGQMAKGSFKGKFGGNRYVGSFNLKQEDK